MLLAGNVNGPLCIDRAERTISLELGEVKMFNRHELCVFLPSNVL